MAQPDPPLSVYRSRFGDTPGFFTNLAIATWDFFLVSQRAMAVAGNFLEIGVYRGRSALLGACHMVRGETCILADVCPIEEVAAAIRSLEGPDVVVASGKSSMLLSGHSLAQFEGTVRWLHIDGDHAGHSVMNDLRVSERFLNDCGVICVDDFFSWRYPQLTAAVYKFLLDTAPLYRMVLCGAGKCYIVRSADYVIYEALIRKYLAGHLRGCGELVTIHKSGHTHDGGCFSLGPRSNEADYHGTDADPADIPF
jgi:hypothetical protein